MTKAGLGGFPCGCKFETLGGVVMIFSPANQPMCYAEWIVLLGQGRMLVFNLFYLFLVLALAPQLYKKMKLDAVI